MKNIKWILIPLLFVLIGGLSGYIIGWKKTHPTKKNILIKARQYAYDPAVINLDLGDTLTIKLASMDVVHGFFLEGFDLDAEIYPNQKSFKIRHRHPSEGYNWKDTTELTIVANKTGKYKYRCSHTCGTMHPFMQGELIINPNSLYHASLGGFTGFFIGMILMFYFRIRRRKNGTN